MKEDSGSPLRFHSSTSFATLGRSTSQNDTCFRLQLAEAFDEPEDMVTVPPAAVVAEKKNLLSKLYSFEKKEEISETTFSVSPPEEVKKTVIEPPRPPPKKVEVNAFRRPF